jgi:TetR/AcrR family transcriptional repressor of nem operon
MGHSRTEKAESHERILDAAAARIRAAGLAAINVAELMRAAGLTHGGFYRHFGSREELVGKALERAFIDGRARASAVKPEGAVASLRGFVRGYLSKSHRDTPERGCAMAALAGDIVRADAAAKALLAEHLQASVDAIAPTLDEPDPARAQRQALAVMSTLVGALTLARAVNDPRLSDALLASARDAVLEPRNQAIR